MATTNKGFSAEEKAAIRQAAAERKRQAEGEAGERDLLAAIEGMTEPDKPIAQGLHALVRREFPQLASRTWYGYPAYVSDGRMLFYYQLAAKFKTRYGHLGFHDSAKLDDGPMWPNSYAILEWNDDVEARVRDLITRALG